MAATMRAFRNCRPLFCAAKSPAAASSSVADAVKPVAKGLNKPVKVSPTLSSFLGGVPEASRTHVVKKVWEHIKLHNLQNPTNKREIICDQKLKTIFTGKDKVNMLEIAKLLSPHFIKTN